VRDMEHPDRACRHTVQALSAHPPPRAHLWRHHAIARSVSSNTFTHAAKRRGDSQGLSQLLRVTSDSKLHDDGSYHWHGCCFS